MIVPALNVCKCGHQFEHHRTGFGCGRCDCKAWLSPTVEGFAKQWERRLGFRPSPMGKWVDVEAKIIRETEKALLVYLNEKGERQWIPRSQVSAESCISHVGEQGILTLSRWIADKKGLA